MKLTITTLCLLISITAIGQINYELKSRIDTIEYVKKLMRKDRTVASYAVGYSGQISKQFQRFIFLLRTLNNEELSELVKDTSACMRVYAYACLAYHHFRSIEQIKAALLNDSTTIPFMFGCAFGDSKVFMVLKQIDKWYNRRSIDKLLMNKELTTVLWFKNFISA